MGLIVSEITNERLIRSFIKHPDIYHTIIEDNCNEIEIDFRKEKWIGFFQDENMIGLYQLEKLNHITLEIHAHVLKKYRKHFSKETGFLILEYIYNELSEFNKVVARIPMLYKNVYDFTKSFGFKDEGINRESHCRNGKIYDVWQLGITRSEIKENIHVYSH